MKPKQIARCLTDMGMVILLLEQMAYSVTGQTVHECSGILLLILFIIHHLLNLQWFRRVRRGQYTAAKILQTMLVVLLFLNMIAQGISGIAMSRHALPFLNIPIPTSAARLLHLACGYWTFLLASVHLGLHWNLFLGLGRKMWGGKPLPKVGKIALRLLMAAAAVYGLVCFFQQDIPVYLFLRAEFVFFDYEKPAFLVAVELLATSFLCRTIPASSPPRTSSATDGAITCWT